MHVFAKNIYMLCVAQFGTICSLKREKHPRRSVIFSKVTGFNLQLYY